MIALDTRTPGGVTMGVNDSLEDVLYHSDESPTKANKALWALAEQIEDLIDGGSLPDAPKAIAKKFLDDLNGMEAPKTDVSNLAAKALVLGVLLGAAPDKRPPPSPYDW
jgi:hypothetical protein